MWFFYNYFTFTLNQKKKRKNGSVLIQILNFGLKIWVNQDIK